MLIKTGIKELVEFVLKSGDIDNRFTGSDRALLGSKIHRQLQKQGGKNYSAEHPIVLNIYEGDIDYVLTGRADGIIEDENGVMIDEIKTVAVPLENIDDSTYPSHWGQARFYRYAVAKEKNINEIKVRLTYYNIDTDEIKRIVKTYSIKELGDYVLSVLKQYRRWAIFERRWETNRNADMKRLAFPFDNYRDGQRSVSRRVYRAQRDKKRLFVNAPTGIGKTMSVLFPSLKSMGEGNVNKIFYLTAKTVTSRRAVNACSFLYQKNDNLHLKSLRITAKDKICLNNTRECNPVACPYAKGYFDKINDIVFDEISNNNVFSSEMIIKTAEEYKICPYELSLDLSVWSDIIICDYNYLFDPQVKLQRFFSGGGDNYAFLIDETHNLPDRVRDMYTATLSKKEVLKVKSKFDKSNKKLYSALNKLNSCLLGCRKQLEENKINHLVRQNPPENIDGAVDRFLTNCTEYFEIYKGEKTDEDLLNLYFDVRFFQKISENYNDKYVTVYEKSGDELKIILFCTDPSDIIDEHLKIGRSAVLFSATLSPETFYRETMGKDGDILTVKSPFPQENLGLYMMDGISTKYADREYTAERLCEIINTVTERQKGNYIVYFPSYSYMNMIKQKYTEIYQKELVIQNPYMSEKERKEFLTEFENKSDILAFCVMGGIYGEGIDLTGDRLIGSIIVGVGLPQISVMLDAVKDHYNSDGKDGFAYAYQYPGMNKVLQAAGRVIRTDTDRGVVVLIDSRFSQPKYLKTMPSHWNHIKRINNTDKLKIELSEFWGK